jgi:hypothetical protein
MDAVGELGRVDGKHAIGLAGVEAERLERAAPVR